MSVKLHNLTRTSLLLFERVGQSEVIPKHLTVKRHLPVVPSRRPSGGSYYGPRWRVPNQRGRVSREPEEETPEAKSHRQVHDALHKVFPVNDKDIRKMPHLPRGETGAGFGMKKLGADNPHRLTGARPYGHARHAEDWHNHVRDGHGNVHDIVTRIAKAMADPHHPVTKQYLEGKALGKKGRQLRRNDTLLDHHLKYAADSGETQMQLNVDPNKRSARSQTRKHLNHTVERLRSESGVNLHVHGRDHEQRHRGVPEPVKTLVASRYYNQCASLFERVSSWVA